MASLVTYKAGLRVLVVITVAASGVAAYYYQQLGTQISRAAGLESQVSNLSGQLRNLLKDNSDLKRQVGELDAPVPVRLSGDFICTLRSNDLEGAYLAIQDMAGLLGICVDPLRSILPGIP